MQITYLGHSSFFLETLGKRIVTDPFGGIGYPFPHVSADAVTVSHGHYDHCEVGAVGGAPAVFRSAGEYELGGIRISAYPSFHDDVHGAKRGANLIFRFEAEGVTVCHLGDIGEPCTPGQLQKVGKADILLVPVGGNYTVDAAGAAEYVRRIAPAVVIPMHYKTPGLQIDIGGVDAFLSLFAGEREVVRVGARISFGREELEKLNKKIIVMERI